MKKAVLSNAIPEKGNVDMSKSSRNDSLHVRDLNCRPLASESTLSLNSTDYKRRSYQKRCIQKLLLPHVDKDNNSLEGTLDELKTTKHINNFLQKIPVNIEIVHRDFTDNSSFDIST